MPTPAEKAPLQGIREETTRVETTEDDSAARDSHFTGVCARAGADSLCSISLLGPGPAHELCQVNVL